MRKTLALAAAAVALTAGLTACSGSDGSSSTAPSTTSAAPSSSASSSTATLTGTFSGLNGKKVAGTVMISGDTIKLSGFSSDEGPDLHLYLTNGTDESAVAAGKEIMSVAHDKADQTFSLKGIDVSRYTNVVVHCDKAKATFGAASLS